MKNSVVILALMLISLGAKAVTGGEATSYVKTGDKVYFGQDVKRGLFFSRIIASDGTVTKIPNRDVLAYMDQSRLFEYLPVVCENNEVICHGMMEYLTSRNGLRLYRYDYCDGLQGKSCFYVFKDGEYYLRVDKKNAMTVLPFFGINNIKIK